jgi:hypothetical protein
MTGEMNARIQKQAQGANDRVQSFPQPVSKAPKATLNCGGIGQICPAEQMDTMKYAIETTDRE